MLDSRDFKNSLCVKWKKKECQTGYNFLDSGTDRIGSMFFDEMLGYFKKNCINKRVVVSSGHLIPNPRNYDKIGKNSLKTWILACKLVKNLNDNDINAKLSLILNDVNLTVDSRKIVFNEYLRLPKSFIEIMKSEGLSPEDHLLCCSFNNDPVFSEKKLSNRTRYLIRRKKTLDKKYDGVNYCLSAFISYFIDLSEQNIDVSVIIFPMCSRINVKRSIDLYSKLNNRLRHICYFDTLNCFL